MAYLLILFPLAMAAVDVRRAVQPLAAVAAAAGRRWRTWPWSRWRSSPATAPPSRGLGRLAAARSARQGRPRLPQRPVLPLLALRAGLPGAPRRPAEPASSARTCSSSLAMMTLVTLSHHLGLMWVAMEATTLVSAPSHLLQPQRPLAGGDLEVPAHRLGRHRPGPVRLVLPRLLVAQGRPGIDAALRPSRPRRPATVAALAARGVRAAVRRLRHQDGPGARCTPGSRTPTAKRRASWARCSPAASRAAPSWRSCGSTRSAAAGPRPSSPARS